MEKTDFETLGMFLYYNMIIVNLFVNVNYKVLRALGVSHSFILKLTLGFN